MSDINDLKERLTILDLRMSEILGKIETVLNMNRDLRGKYDELDTRLKQDEHSRKKSEWTLFKLALIVGSLSGVLPGLIVAYLMKVYEALSIPFWTWLTAPTTAMTIP
jgi:hypothetical protein